MKNKLVYIMAYVSIYIKLPILVISTAKQSDPQKAKSGWGTVAYTRQEPRADWVMFVPLPNKILTIAS